MVGKGKNHEYELIYLCISASGDGRIAPPRASSVGAYLIHDGFGQYTLDEIV